MSKLLVLLAQIHSVLLMLLCFQTQFPVSKFLPLRTVLIKLTEHVGKSVKIGYNIPEITLQFSDQIKTSLSVHMILIWGC